MLLSDVPLPHVIVLAVALFLLGMLGVLLKRSIILMLMSVELMLNAANLLFVGFANRFQNVHGHVVAFFVMAIAAAEAAVGLAILIGIYRTHQTTDIQGIRDLAEN